MILICYDGSPDARAAIETAGELLDCQPAIVVTVWQPFAEMLAAMPLGLGFAPGVLDIDKADEASREARDAVGLAMPEFSDTVRPGI